MSALFPKVSDGVPCLGVPADLRADLGLTPKFYSWDGSFSGSFTSDYSDVSVDVSGGSGTVSVTVRLSIPPNSHIRAFSPSWICRSGDLMLKRARRI